MKTSPTSKSEKTITHCVIELTCWPFAIFDPYTQADSHFTTGDKKCLLCTAATVFTASIWGPYLKCGGGISAWSTKIHQAGVAPLRVSVFRGGYFWWAKFWEFMQYIGIIFTEGRGGDYYTAGNIWLEWAQKCSDK